MKHTLKITTVLIFMFVLTQLIGLYVVDHYSVGHKQLPYGMETPEIKDESQYATSLLPSIIMAFVIAITLMFLLMKFKAEVILKIWFFLVVTISIGISLTSFFPAYMYVSIAILAVSVILAFLKIFKRDFLVHNLTELLIYPGIAAIFVPILNVFTTIILLLLISAYDMWAVWHSGLMQKMAKYQMNTLKVFGGLMVPYASKSVKQKIKNMKKSELKKSKIRINLAILGGGDLVFPLITAGVMLVKVGLWPALMVIGGSALGLSYLFFAAKKKQFYPAMPFITIGIFVSMIISYLIF